MLSMWPLIHKSDQIVDLKPAKDYDIDDIIVFLESSRLVAHRIIYKFETGENGYITKGDNNRVSDSRVPLAKILGKATSIRRKNKIIKIDTIYKLQASNYLKILNEFHLLASKTGLDYIVLKGIPIYLKYTKNYPRHFIFDADILIYPKDKSKLIKILTQLKFSLGSTHKDAKEFSAVKKVDNMITSLDIHLEPAIAFSQFSSFNRLLPQIDKLTLDLWETSVNHLLTPNHQFIYLLLHVFHHSYAGTTRWDLISKVRSNKNVKATSCLKIIKKLNLENLVHGPLSFLEKYYGKNPTSSLILKNIKPSKRGKILTQLICAFIKPWSHHHHYINRLELLIYIYILSPLPTYKKIQIFLYSIKSLDFKILINWIKSRFA